MKAGWNTEVLGDLVARIETVDPTKNPTEHFTYVDVSSVSNETFEITQTSQVLGRDAPSRARRLMRTGDVIFATIRPTLKRIASVPNTLDQQVCSTGYMVLRALPKLHPRFLFHYLFTDQFQGAMEELQTGASYPAVTDGQVRQQPIPLPPLEEQQRIVAVLGEAFEGLTRARAHAEANLQNARELFDSFLGEIARCHAETYGTATVEALAMEVTDGDHMPPPKAKAGVPFITISNVNKDTRQIDFTDTFMVPEAYYNSLKEKRQPRAGDVLYTVTGSFGIPILVEGEQSFCFQRHIALVRPKAGIESEWLYYMLLSPFAFDQANDGATGTAQRTVSLKLLRGLQLPNTPVEIQPDVATNLRSRWEANQTIVESYRAKLNDLDALRQSLLQKAFAGELT